MNKGAVSSDSSSTLSVAAASKSTISATTTEKGISTPRDASRLNGTSSQPGGSTRQAIGSGIVGAGAAQLGIGVNLKSASKPDSKAKKPKTIQDDANASATYKSLFNTHATALNQPKAHWVTYNPQYFR